jgi:hypothetical protein
MSIEEPGAGAPPEAPKKTTKIACAISGKERPRRDLVSLETLRPSLRNEPARIIPISRRRR